METYGRYDIVLDRGSGSYVTTVDNKTFLDVGGGIAVNALGHAHPEIVETIHEQASKLVHVSNLYYTETQGRLAERLSRLFSNATGDEGTGKVFFSNSGAEANEGLYKLARASGQATGRYKIVTATNSFHGRTLGGIAATGQDKIKQGFHPIIDGFSHVPFNDLGAMESSICPETAAVLIEGIQGEGGVTAATVEYLTGLRELCDRHGILLMMDGVQCGHFRTGRFQSYDRILEGTPEETSFSPDAVSMAKSLGSGMPIGAFWVSEKHSTLLQAGMHGTTYGGNPLACAVGNKVLDIIERDGLADNARRVGDRLISEIGNNISDRYPAIVKGIGGLGCMLGIRVGELDDVPVLPVNRPATTSTWFVDMLHHEGVLTVPAGPNIVRLLPPYNISDDEVTECLERIETVCKKATQA
jgi:acetylornithine aminotransferase/acetylornithine/N-succinyldiaminopimelate aminotransferase